jgi:predicted DNA-binding transcriptional regulator AlpA
MRNGVDTMTDNNAITEVEAAEALGLKVATLRAWRHRHTGPRFVRFGRAVRYLLDDLDAFIAASRVDTGDDSEPDEPEEIARP